MPLDALYHDLPAILVECRRARSKRPFLAINRRQTAANARARSSFPYGPPSLPANTHAATYTRYVLMTAVYRLGPIGNIHSENAALGKEGLAGHRDVCTARFNAERGLEKGGAQDSCLRITPRGKALIDVTTNV